VTVAPSNSPSAKSPGISLLLLEIQIFKSSIEVGPAVFYLVVSTHLKNVSQNGNLPQIGMKIKIFETTT